ncbi:hypothetical protein [Stenotrophomonas sp.]|uniref:hypothetical protein n=1 Tax=Stenotrophomonas sp. TaxID=69392 RepID=UPI0028B1E561|nr:hypothetical protein [Stenotrophomonas sp.]
MATARTFLAALCLVLSGCAATGQPEPSPAAEVTTDGDVTVPANLVITSPRICAALAVYELADHDDWGLRGTIAATALNGFRAADRVPNCAAGVAVALTADFSPRRWQDALDAVDAVASGSYPVPDACARATAVLPLSAVNAGSPSAARAHCVIYDLAFVGGAQ